MLCPVLWAAPAGAVVVMAAAESITEDEFSRLVNDELLPEWDYDPADGLTNPTEPGAKDWGRYQGRIVAIDYAALHAVLPGHPASLAEEA